MTKSFLRDGTEPAVFVFLRNMTYPYCAVLAQLLSEYRKLFDCFNEDLPAKTALVSLTVSLTTTVFVVHELH